MFTLVLCIILNSLIGVIFKLFEKYKIDNFQAIVVNYFTCVMTAAVTFMKNPFPPDVKDQPWFFYALMTGILFIVVFNIVAITVQKTGVMLATIFQKISLIAPTLIAILGFGEKSGPMKWTGILFAILSILLLSQYGDRSVPTKHNRFAHLLFPILTFIGSCIIDSMIFLIIKKGYVQYGDHEFVSTLFLIAGCTGTVFLLYSIITGKSKVELKNIIAGIGLGIPNFFTIYLLFNVLQQGLEGSVVFPINNAGVLMLASLYGIFIFKESINSYKILGFIMAITAIFMISFAG